MKRARDADSHFQSLEFFQDDSARNPGQDSKITTTPPTAPANTCASELHLEGWELPPGQL